MAFSQSLEFGNSTLLNLETEVKCAIDNGSSVHNKSILDAIQESPPDSSYQLGKSCARLHKVDKTKLNSKVSCIKYNSHHNFRRSKSDSLLPTKDPSMKIVQENYSQFFQSEFSLDRVANDVVPQKVEESVIRVSQIEAALLDIFCDDQTKGGSVFEVPVCSEDLCNLLETEGEAENSSYKNSVIESEELTNLDASCFVGSACDAASSQQLMKDLAQCRSVLKIIEEEAQNIKRSQTKLELTLSRMSPEQLKWSGAEENKATEKENATPIIHTKDLETLKSLNTWNLPLSVLKEYERKGVRKMFDWQAECLYNPKVLFEHCNLVYSAPTSAGKTLVSEILLLKTVLERRKKVLVILPFISVVREKMLYLQDLLTSTGFRVEGFFGGYTPPGGFDSIHVAICTIEKANSIVNKLMENGKLDEIGTVVVDEIHLISDPGRGYILELLLAKILYMSKKFSLQIQVITMSATLANIELLKHWLKAELFITDFRPVALKEMIKVGRNIYDNKMQFIREITAPLVGEKYAFPAFGNDADHIAQLCIETILEACSVIIFCPSKDWCENLAVQLASVIHSLIKTGNDWGQRLRVQLNRVAIDDVKKQLRDIPTGLDSVLEKTISYACAFHHAGLTTEERDIVEASFKAGALKVIVATSTLSSGVNLPARRVLIRSPLFGGKQMNSLTYRQMIGRAGRTGKDTLGESILICTESNARMGRSLITAELQPICSCLNMDSSTHLKRALLEVITSGVAATKEDIDSFVNCTLLSVQKQLNQQDQDKSFNDEVSYINEALDFLLEYEFIRLQKDDETEVENYVATQLGLACLASSMPPSDGLLLFAELQKARRCFVLESELHAVYLVTPYSVCYQLQELDWLLFLDMWEKLSPALKKVGELVGVKESFLVRAMRGQTKQDYKLMQIHKRFYIAMALQELVNETPINVVSHKFKCTRGMLQSLQQMASTFAGIVTAFCTSLQWSTLSLIVSQFKERLYFGIHRDLIDLMRLPHLTQKRARALYNAGVTSLVELANAEAFSIEKILYNSLSFDSVKQHEHENSYEAEQRSVARNIFITGKLGMTVTEAAKLLIKEARKFVEFDIGVENIKWIQEANDCKKTGKEHLELHMSYEESKLQSGGKTINMTKQQTSPKLGKVMKSQADKKLMTEQIVNKNCNLPQTSNNKGILKQENAKIIKILKSNEIQQVNPMKYENENEEARKIKTNENFYPKESKLKKTLLQKKLKESNVQGKQKECIGDTATSGLITEALPLSDGKPSTSHLARKALLQKEIEQRRLEALEKIKRKRLESGFAQTKDIETSKTKLNSTGTSIDNKENIHKIETSVLTRKSIITAPLTVNLHALDLTPKTALQPSLSPRNKISSKSNINTRLNVTNEPEHLKDDDFFMLNTNFSTEMEQKVSQAETFENDEIPNTQQPADELKYESTSKSLTPHALRLLRSYHYQRTPRLTTPKLEQKQSVNLERVTEHNEASSSFNMEFSDLSMENSLMKYPLQLNASHILSCSKVESGSSSFKTIDIIDICGDQYLFEAAINELLAAKRFGFSIGLQRQISKQIPIIGANLLINQAAAAEKSESELCQSLLYQIGDSNFIAGIAFSITDNVVYYMNLQEDSMFGKNCPHVSTAIKLKKLRLLCADEKITFLTHDAKEQFKVLRRGINDLPLININVEDPKVANWLLQPDHIMSFQNLCQQFAPECMGLVDLCGGGSRRSFSSIGLDVNNTITAKIRCSVEACVTVHVLKSEIENLERIGTGQLYKFFKELEMPLQLALCNMELFGFPVCETKLQKIFLQLVESMKRIEHKIYELFGARFNLGSSTAVAKVLGLHRKPNGRVSTSRQILEKIDSPISQLIVTYRKMSVTLTKSIQPLLRCVDQNRIHGQSITYTATGRISMSEPNLQNVAKDFNVEIGSEKQIISCRSAFVPIDEKRCLISADFCQLEMRILAFLSQDNALLSVINSDRDVFVAIAAGWNNLRYDEVSDQLRNGTKQICYGIIYGMGMRSLAEALKCTEQEATMLSQQFHAAYPGIRVYIDKVVKFARKNGYVETISGRRRYLNNINASEPQIRGQAERQAINSTIQGTAADIAKSAILCMEKNVLKYSEKLGIDENAVRFVLHLHDELLFEVPTDKSKKIAKVLRLSMEHCVKLNLPLKVKLKIGRSWAELKDLAV